MAKPVWLLSKHFMGDICSWAENRQVKCNYLFIHSFSQRLLSFCYVQGTVKEFEIEKKLGKNVQIVGNAVTSAEPSDKNSWRSWALFWLSSQEDHWIGTRFLKNRGNVLFRKERCFCCYGRILCTIVASCRAFIAMFVSDSDFSPVLLSVWSGIDLDYWGLKHLYLILIKKKDTNFSFIFYKNNRKQINIGTHFWDPFRGNWKLLPCSQLHDSSSLLE